ncbi:hypothetical protein CGLO_11737 [Colletotrichum gloeosporioides Cg-14]|uniref:Uncharacterized protein n=1 Tax=Colletotrichum gloeosporioides (strain Cg-14) TaxID=1237896 RepID=T0LB66_COLGC|nr:hypothetical protein CGLO_11737 [Colletotrichum gloeosporioides Cg-14]
MLNYTICAIKFWNEKPACDTCHIRLGDKGLHSESDHDNEQHAGDAGF